MANPRKYATYQDLIDLPPNYVGEIIDGELHAQPRPAVRHAIAASALGEELGPPFRRGRGGPGGWVLLREPELHFGRDVVVPDLAGWRRERMPADTIEQAFITLAPDWVCEALSPSTRKLDRGAKRDIYAREAVTHLWFIDAVARSLEVLHLDGSTYQLIATYSDDTKVRAEPFDAIELDLALLWSL